MQRMIIIIITKKRCLTSMFFWHYIDKMYAGNEYIYFVL